MRLTPPELTLIQLSDTHLCAEGELLHGSVDTFATLETALGTITSSRARVHGLLLTGDLANEGKPEAYRRLASALAPAAAELRAEVVYAMGNHDERAAFRRELRPDSPGDGPVDSVRWIEGVRVVVLDSSTPARPDGRLEPAQLEWLRDELASPAPRGSLLAVHHPPLPSPVPSAHLLRLQNADDLATALTGTDVRLIVTGHAHHTGCGSLAGIPVWVGPALAYRSDPLPPPGRLRGRVGAGISRIDLIDGAFVATAVEIGAAPVVYDDDKEERVRYALDKFFKDG
ncbi:metallophosphoesterase [Amycolatopsis rhabdoformis]|uniref:Metallophosphoesterase n=1 Tax=Amycolatopsis rhabdoformis TaxID=1448059 RepID=A0ABZ1IGL2_9PSEU|nr:metallophosphoesterase [Amycolatopsis rhabdoformis]WSE33231.1 metallophosphoesterase [Amycolatopsis rhabdoformis]